MAVCERVTKDKKNKTLYIRMVLWSKIAFSYNKRSQAGQPVATKAGNEWLLAKALDAGRSFLSQSYDCWRPDKVGLQAPYGVYFPTLQLLSSSPILLEYRHQHDCQQRCSRQTLFDEVSNSTVWKHTPDLSLPLTPATAAMLPLYLTDLGSLQVM